MTHYGRVIARLSLVGCLIAGAVLLSSKPVQADVSCPQLCAEREQLCINTCEGESQCITDCELVAEECVRGCA